MSVFPDNERERLEFLKSLHILDSESEQEFDDIVKLASTICNTPIALISLLDENRQWFKAKVGLDVNETPRNISFCQHAILDSKIFEVENAIENSTFKSNPLVTEKPNIRFYAGAPITDESGLNIGTLCVIDYKKNKLNETQKEALNLLAKQAISLIKLRLKKKELEIYKNTQESLIKSLQEGYVYQRPTGEIINCNKAAEEILGLSFDQMMGKKSVDPSWRAIHEDGSNFPGETHPAMETIRTGKALEHVIMGVHKPNNELSWISINSTPIFKDNGNELDAVVCTFKDVTKAKSIELEYKKIKEHTFISKIIAKTKDAIIITDKNGKTIWINNAFEKLSGYKLEEIIGKKPGDFLQGPDTDPKTVNQLAEAIKNKKEIEVTILNYSKEKHPYWLNLNISPIFKDTNPSEVEYFIAVERDVTIMVNIEREKQQQYENLIESQSIAKIGNWEFNLLTNELLWSDELFTIFEIDKLKTSKDELYQKYLSRIFPEDLHSLESKIENAVTNGEDSEIEHRVLGKKGIKYVYGKAKVVKDEFGKPKKLKGTLQDITDKKLKDIEYNISNERWRFAVENSGDGIWDYDLINKTSFQSDQFLNIIGYKRGELDLVHDSILEMIHPDDRNEVDQEFKNHLIGKTPLLSIEYRIKHKDGYYKWIYDRAKVIEYTENGQPKRIIGIHQDLTERKKVERLHKTINKLNNLFINTSQNNYEAFKSLNDSIIDLTDSEYGFIGEVFYDENNQPWLKSYALTNIAWDEETQKLYDEYHQKGFEFRNLNTLFGYTLKNKEVTISDNPKNDSRAGGLPNGHPDLNKFLGLPIIYDNKLIGMIGLANKPIGYTLEDVNFLNPLIENIASVIQYVKTKRIEEEQQKLIAFKENRIRTLIEGMDELVFVLDKDLRYKEYFVKKNNENENLFVSPEFFLGKRIDEIGFTPSLVKEIEEVINRNITLKSNEKLDYMLKINNEEKWFQASYSITKNEINEVEDIIVVSRDITEEVINRNQLEQYQKELQNFFDLTNDYMCIANIDGTFKRVNNQFVKSLGYSAVELNEKLFMDFVHPDDIQITLDEVNKLANGIPTIGFENRYLTKNGDYIWLSWRTSPDPTSGLLYATARDVTNEKIIKQQLLEQKQYAEKANTAKSEFLANMSHEIRTPLNGIIGFSEILQKTTLNENQQIYTDTLVQAGKSLLNIVNDILDFSKIEAGKLELNIQKTKINELIYEAIDVVTFQAQSKDIDLIIDIDETLPTNVFCDSIQLKQVIINLLGNAIKFTQEGEVVAQLRTVSQANNKIKIKFSIIDSGIGIAEENIIKIFEAFSQADNTTTRQFGGTGLGLNISNSLIKLMGGNELKVNSKINEGSEFHFELELDYEATSHIPIFEETKQLLLVNKNIHEGEIIKRSLGKDNILTTLIGNVQEAKELINKNSTFDFLLVDSQLYNQDNNSSLKELVSTPNFSIERTPIGLITRSIHDETFYEECKSFGVKARINRPIKIERLRSQLLELSKNKTQPTNNSIISTKKIKILVADDNAINRLLIKTVIESWNLNIELIEAKNGQEAVDLYSEKLPDLIFMDIMMPVLNGYEATIKILNIKGNHTFKIYALTAGDQNDIFAKENMDGILDKPIDSEKLKNIIESCFINK